LILAIFAKTVIPYDKMLDFYITWSKMLYMKQSLLKF